MDLTNVAKSSVSAAHQRTGKGCSVEGELDCLGILIRLAC